MKTTPQIRKLSIRQNLFGRFDVVICVFMIYIIFDVNLYYVWQVWCGSMAGLMWIYIMFSRLDVVWMYNSFNHFSCLPAEFHTLDSVFGCWHSKKGTHCLAEGHVIGFLHGYGSHGLGSLFFAYWIVKVGPTLSPTFYNYY